MTLAAAALHGGPSVHRRSRRLHRYVIVFLAVVSISVSASAQWSSSFRGAAFGIHNTEAGPEDPRSENFSTNWLEVRGRYDTASGFFFGLRGRGSLEPYTIKEEGYPQLLQYVSPYAGGEVIDRMRARDLIEEAAVEVGWRSLRLYAAPIGEPTLGPRPYGLRESSMDLAVAPFAYDIQESFHVKTQVVNAALDMKYFTLEGGVFHDAVSDGKHTSLETGGDIDSWAARVTVKPTDRVSFQVSRGELGDAVIRKISSASIGYEGPVVAATAMWTRREEGSLTPLDAYGIEVAIRVTRSTITGRFENVDRPAIGSSPARRTGHGTVGYVFDAIARPGWRAGLGVNVDYHTNSRALTGGVYGHKPQTIYFFARVRTAAQ
jgi:hypothetical protein